LTKVIIILLGGELGNRIEIIFAP